MCMRDLGLDRIVEGFALAREGVCLSLLYVAKQAQIAMAGGDSIEMLVVLCNHKRKTNFSGSSLQDLHDCVASSMMMS